MNYNWVHADPLPDGHTLYTRDNGDLAIGDRSGALPEQTSDGVMWLDLGGDRIPSYDSIMRGILVPVIADKDKREHKVLMTLLDFLLVADQWGGRVNVRGIVFCFMKHADVEELHDTRGLIFPEDQLLRIAKANGGKVTACGPVEVRSVQALARMGYGTVKLSDTVDINGSISSAVFTINEED